MTQKEMIIADLEKGKTIDSLMAWKRYGCSKLATRLSELSRPPFNLDIQKEWKVVKSPFGKKEVMTYKLKK